MLNHRIIGLLPHGGSVDSDQAYFGATQQGAELDLLLFKDGRRLGVKAKCMDAPTLTPCIRIAPEDLHLEQRVVLYPGARRYAFSERVIMVPLYP